MKTMITKVYPSADLKNRIVTVSPNPKFNHPDRAMKPVRSCRSLAFVCLFVTSVSFLALTGCSGLGSASFPDAAANPAQVPVGSIQGSVYGGHAPLVGAHVYLLSPGTSGYGSQASSLLCATLTGNAQTTCQSSLTKNSSDPNIPTSWYYIPTDATGAFNLTGNYTCTAGSPVYIYAYGGSPTYPSAQNNFPVASFTVATATSIGKGGGAKQQYEYTGYFTLDTTTGQGYSNPIENFYIGEQVQIGNITNHTFLNGIATVQATNLSTTTFNLNGTYDDAVGNSQLSGTVSLVGSYGNSEGEAIASPTFNPGVVNLATLGVCPSTGSLAAGGTLFNGSTSSAIHYIYMNEVSTAVTAYAFEGFTPTTVTSTTNATDIGSSATNLIGIENAALNAAQLYDINGSQITTSYAGEGHIANPKTPAGNGRTPQLLLDTMGNILAACVDSNNTSTIDGNASESPQCATLFETATGNGIPKSVTGYGTIPVDTAQAMLNIAHYPAGDPASTSTFMANLYGLPSGNVPFTPHLTTQPNDFTVAIQYSSTGQTNTNISSATTLTGNAYASGPESIAIDGYGNPWINTLNGGNSPWNIFQINPLGVVTYTSANATYKLGYITIDPSNNIFSGSNYAQGDEFEVVAAGTVNTSATRTTYTYTGNYGGTTAPFNADGFYNGYMSVANGAGNIFIGATSPATNNGNATTAQGYTIALNPSTPGTFASLFTPYSMGTTIGSIGAHGAVENASTGDIWWSNEEYVGTTTNAFAINRVNATTGKPETGFPIQYATNNAVDRPESAAIDKNGNFWAAARLGNTLLEVTQAGTLTTNHTGNTLATPFGISIDGDNNILIGANVTGTSIAKFSIANNTNLSPPTTNYTLGGQLTDPLNIAMDQSGNLWITTNTNNTVVEWIGAGAPLYNPLSLASKNNALSTRP
jgi:hypothetical protein